MYGQREASVWEWRCWLQYLLCREYHSVKQPAVVEEVTIRIYGNGASIRQHLLSSDFSKNICKTIIQPLLLDKVKACYLIVTLYQKYKICHSTSAQTNACFIIAGIDRPFISISPNSEQNPWGWTMWSFWKRFNWHNRLRHGRLCWCFM